MCFLFLYNGGVLVGFLGGVIKCPLYLNIKCLIFLYKRSISNQSILIWGSFFVVLIAAFIISMLQCHMLALLF